MRVFQDEAYVEGQSPADRGLLLLGMEVGDRFVVFASVREAGTHLHEPGAFVFSVKRMEVARTPPPPEGTSEMWARILWMCDVIVTRDLDVFYEPKRGSVPREMLACALEGPGW